VNNNNVADGRTSELRIWLSEFRLRITSTISSRSRKTQRSIVLPLLECVRSTKCLLQISVRRNGDRKHERRPFPSKCTMCMNASSLHDLCFITAFTKRHKLAAAFNFF